MHTVERVPGEELAPGTVTAERREPRPDAPLIGVLALQGDVLEHLRMLAEAGARAVPVKRAAELAGLDGLVIPGGESTTIGRLADLYGLLDPIRARIGDGLPVFGTCAGAILLASSALSADGTPSAQPLLGVMDTVVRRNAFGRQVDSAELDVGVEGLEGARCASPSSARRGSSPRGRAWRCWPPSPPPPGIRSWWPARAVSSRRRSTPS